MASAPSRSAARSPAVALKEKKDVLELEGVVLEALPSAKFRVQLDDTEQVILAHVSGKIRKNVRGARALMLNGRYMFCFLCSPHMASGFFARVCFRSLSRSSLAITSPASSLRTI